MREKIVNPKIASKIRLSKVGNKSTGLKFNSG